MVRLSGAKSNARVEKQGASEAIPLSHKLYKSLLSLVQVVKDSTQSCDDTVLETGGNNSEKTSGDERGGGSIPASHMLESTLQGLCHETSTLKQQGDVINCLRGWVKQRTRVWELRMSQQKLKNSGTQSLKRARKHTADHQEHYSSDINSVKSWMNYMTHQDSEEDDCLMRQCYRQELVAVFGFVLLLFLSPENDKLRRWTIPLLNVCKLVDIELFYKVFDSVSNALLNVFFRRSQEHPPTDEELVSFESGTENFLRNTQGAYSCFIDRNAIKFGNKHDANWEWLAELMSFSVSSLTSLLSVQDVWGRLLTRQTPPALNLLLEWTLSATVSLGGRINQAYTSEEASMRLMSLQTETEEVLKVIGGLLHFINKHDFSEDDENVFEKNEWKCIRTKLVSIVKFSLLLQNTLRWHSYTTNQIALVVVHSLMAYHYATACIRSDTIEDHTEFTLKALVTDIFACRFGDSQDECTGNTLLSHPVEQHNPNFGGLISRACIGILPDALLVYAVSNGSRISSPTRASVFILDVLFPKVQQYCSFIDPAVRSQAFQALHEWIKKTRSLIGPLLEIIAPKELTIIASEILEMTLSNWDHPTKYVSNIMQSIFREVLKLYSAAKEVIAMREKHKDATVEGETLQSVLLKLLFRRSNARKSKFTALETLFAEWGVLNCLKLYPSILSEIVNAIGHPANMTGPISSCWFSLIVKARQECEQVCGLNAGTYLGTGSYWKRGKMPKYMSTEEYGVRHNEAISKWRQLWLRTLCTSLVVPKRRERLAIADYLLPLVMKVDELCFDHVMKELRRLQTEEVKSELPHTHICAGDDGNTFEDRIVWAQLSLIYLSRSRGLLEREWFLAIFRSAHKRLQMQLKSFYRSFDVMRLSRVDIFNDMCQKENVEMSDERIDDYGCIVYNCLCHHDIELRLLAVRTVVTCDKQTEPMCVSELALFLFWLLTSAKVRQQEVKQQITPMFCCLLDRVKSAHRTAQKRLEFLEKVQRECIMQHFDGCFESLRSHFACSGLNDIPVVIDGETIDLTSEMAEEISKDCSDCELWRQLAVLAGFVQTLGALLLSGLYSSSPFDRVGIATSMITTLCTYFPVVTTSTSATRNERRDYVEALRFGQPNKKVMLLDNPLHNPLALVLCTSSTTHILLSRLRGNWDDIRRTVLKLLISLPSPFIGVESHGDVNYYLEMAMSSLCNPRPRNCDVGASLLQILCTQYVQKLNWELQTDGIRTYHLAAGSTKPLYRRNLELVDFLLLLLSRRSLILDRYISDVCTGQRIGGDEFGQINLKPEDVSENPVFASPLLHGLLMGIRYLFRIIPLKYTDSDYRLELQESFGKACDTVLTAYRIALKIVAERDEDDGNLLEEKEGANNVEFQSYSKGRVDCRGHLIFDDTSGDPVSQGVSEDDGESPQQTLAVAAWMIVREASTCLYELLEFALDSDKSLNESNRLLSKARIQTVGDTFLEALLSLKHMGGVTYATLNFQKTCKKLLVHENEELRSIPVRWLTRLFEKVTDGGHQFILRRSAGLPLGITSLVCSEPTLSSCQLLHKVIVSLIYLADPECLRDGHDVAFGTSWKHQLELIASPSCVTRVREPTWRMRVHALNSLRSVVRESSISNEIQPYLARILRASLSGFRQVEWAVRNSSMMVFAAVVDKMVGTKKASNETSDMNKVPCDVFFDRYPSLRNFLVDTLQDAVQATKGRRIGTFGSGASCLYPILVLLSRLDQPVYQPESSQWENVDDNDPIKRFTPLVLECLTLNEYWARQLSAGVLNNLLINQNKMDMIRSLIMSSIEFGGKLERNSLHGYVLGASSLLGRLYESFLMQDNQEVRGDMISSLNRNQAAYARVRQEHDRDSVDNTVKDSSTGENLRYVLSSINSEVDSLFLLCNEFMDGCPWIGQSLLHFLYIYCKSGLISGLWSTEESVKLVSRFQQICLKIIHDSSSAKFLVGKHHLLCKSAEFFVETLFLTPFPDSDRVDIADAICSFMEHSASEVRWMTVKVIKREMRKTCKSKVRPIIETQLVKLLQQYFQGGNLRNLSSTDKDICRYSIRALRLLTGSGALCHDVRSLFPSLAFLHGQTASPKLKMDILLVSSAILGSEPDDENVQSWMTMVEAACCDMQSFTRRICGMKSVALLDTPILSRIPFLRGNLWKQIYLCAQDDDDEVRDAARQAAFALCNKGGQLNHPYSNSSQPELILGRSDLWTHSLVFLHLSCEANDNFRKGIVFSLFSRVLDKILESGTTDIVAVDSIATRMFTTQSQNEFFEPLSSLLYCLLSSPSCIEPADAERLHQQVQKTQETVDVAARTTLETLADTLKAMSQTCKEIGG